MFAERRGTFPPLFVYLLPSVAVVANMAATGASDSSCKASLFTHRRDGSGVQGCGLVSRQPGRRKVRFGHARGVRSSWRRAGLPNGVVSGRMSSIWQ